MTSEIVCMSVVATAKAAGTHVLAIARAHPRDGHRHRMPTPRLAGDVYMSTSAGPSGWRFSSAHEGAPLRHRQAQIFIAVHSKP